MPPLLRPRRWITALVMGAIAVGPARAQTQTGVVSGRIVDRATSQPIDDARVVIVGTTLEALSNARGEYRIANVRPGRVQLGVFRLGYRAAQDTVRVAANETATLDFLLQQSLTTLSEVVVTGTAGNQERRAQAAQVASVAATDIKQNAAITTVNEMLQSRVAGISVGAASGTAGTNRQIRIRGAASISLSNQPIIFVDGVRVQEGVGNLGLNQGTDRMNDINPDDIESIEVVKGPAAATLYGADASTGVIQIITKRGRAGTNSFTQTVRAEGGVVRQNWAPPANYGLCTAALVAANSPNPLCRGQTAGTLVSDNPIVREGAFRTGYDALFGWSGRGGGQSYGYFVSAGSDRNAGTLPNNEFQRQSLRTNFNFVPTSKLTFDAGFQLIRSDAKLPDNDNNIYGFLGGSMLGSPLTRRDDGVLNENGWFGFARHVPAITAIDNSLETRRSIVTAAATYYPTSWFKNRLTLGGDLLSDDRTRYFPKNSIGSYAGALNTGNNQQGRVNIQRYTVDYLADLNRKFGRDNQFDATLSLGAQVIATHTDSVGAEGQGFASNSSHVISSASTRSGGQSTTDVRQVGYLGQFQLGWSEKRFLQFGARLDDFSAFGTNTNPIFLPKIGASWVVSDESFAQPLTRVFSSLRLRAAFGTTGRAPTAGAALTTLSPAPFAIQAGSAVAVNAGAIPLNPGNKDLKPEKGIEYEAGVDATMLNERLSIEATYYDKTSRDVLVQRPLPPSQGFQQNPFVNIGEINNRGVEVALTGQLLRMRNFGWESRLNFSTLHNELVSLGGVAPFGTLNRFTEGYQLGAFVSKRIKSIDQQTGVVTVADTFEVVGNNLPTFEAGWSNTITLFRNLRISALVDTKQDFLLYNNADYFRETQVVRSRNRLDPKALSPLERLRRYGNPTAGRPAFVQQNGRPTTVDAVRDAYVQPGDFVRFRELAFNFTVPQRLVGRLGRVSGMQLGVAFQNIGLWTDYQGADPEVVSNATNTGAAQFSRTDFFTLPNPRRTLFRVNFSF